MRRVYLALGGLLLILVLMLAAASCVPTPPAPPATLPPSPTTTPAATPKPTATPAPSITQEQSQGIARAFVVNEPTFVFDGMADTLKFTGTVALKTPESWQFSYQFDSRHAGYGDRTGRILAQVITRHEAVVTVVSGKVTAATMDGKWDMLKQQLVS